LALEKAELLRNGFTLPDTHCLVADDYQSLE